MTFGLDSLQYSEISNFLVQPLKGAGASVFIFGSRARGDHREFSGVDIMVESSKDLSSLVAQIKEHFQQGNFPFKVDLVEKRHFSKAYLPSFEQDKIKL